MDFSFADAFVVATAENASTAQLKGSKDESQMVYGTVELKSRGSCWYVGSGSMEKMLEEIPYYSSLADGICQKIFQ